jgi:hypothetical protein
VPRGTYFCHRQTGLCEPETTPKLQTPCLHLHAYCDLHGTNCNLRIHIRIRSGSWSCSTSDETACAIAMHQVTEKLRSIEELSSGVQPQLVLSPLMIVLAEATPLNRKRYVAVVHTMPA